MQRLSVAVERGLGAGGTFVAINNRVSQSVPHLHAHIVPRTKGDGLRGFFWPRTKYASDDEAATYAAKIAEAHDPPRSWRRSAPPWAAPRQDPPSAHRKAAVRHLAWGWSMLVVYERSSPCSCVA